MLTTLLTLKLRLAISPSDTTHDTILFNALNAISARFDLETNRTLARTVDATHEFDPSQTEISVPCYPIESVTKLELKTSEQAGWSEQPMPPYLIRQTCIVSFSPIPRQNPPQNLLTHRRRLRAICNLRLASKYYPNSEAIRALADLNRSPDRGTSRPAARPLTEPPLENSDA